MKYLKLFEYFDDDVQNEHIGMWLHGGTGKYKGGDFLYVTDDLKEALHYARLKGGVVYKLKDEYNYTVNWAFGHSEGMIPQEQIQECGGFDNMFEVFIEL